MDENFYLPRCQKCGAEMYPSPVEMNCITRQWVSSNKWYECRNPDCEDCPEKFKIAAAETEYD